MTFHTFCAVVCTAESAHAMHIHFEEKMIFKLIPFLHNVHQFTWRTGGELALPADFDCLAMLIALSTVVGHKL